jgi:thioredoxin-related protein
MLRFVSLLALSLTFSGATIAQLPSADSGHAVMSSAFVMEGSDHPGGLQTGDCRTVVSLPASKSVSMRYVPVQEYDPSRDAVQDVQDAVLEANRTGRNVFIQVGGEWCGWCHRLDRLFREQPQLSRLRDENFVTVLVNFSEENRNKQLLKRLPEVSGYPHFFILDGHGSLLAAKSVYNLEQGKGYNSELIEQFLRTWSSQSSPVKCAP